MRQELVSKGFILLVIAACGSALKKEKSLQSVDEERQKCRKGAGEGTFLA